MMNCKQATQLLSEAQDRKLSLKDRAALKLHVMMCSGCSNFSQQMLLLRDFTRGYTKGTSDINDIESLIKRFNEGSTDSKD